MAIHELVLDMQVSLLSSDDGGEAIRLAAVLAEAALKDLLGKDPTSRPGLGEMIGEVHRSPDHRDRLGPALIKQLNWLNERRKASVHFKGEFDKPSVDDGNRAAEIARALLLATDAVDETELGDIVREAEWKASTPATSSVLKLDRTTQRSTLDDLLGLRRRIVAVLIDGEVGQGHDHFGEVMKWRLRAIPKGRWRDLQIDWPAPSDSAGTRYAYLVETLCDELGIDLELPDDADPMAEPEAWDRALEPLFVRLERSRTRLSIRHTIGWLSDDDTELISAYLRRIWAAAARRKGERVLLAFEVQRAQATGMPLLGKGWRISRRERKVATAIAELLDNIELPKACRCSALDELTSVTEDDLVQWFRNEHNRGRAAAEKEAQTVLAATDGGRFELVVKRLASLTKG